MGNVTNNPLGYQPIGKLLGKFAVPSIVAMLVSSLYNIVDQIFIGQGVGYLGNAATNVAFPLVTICMAMTLAIGIGSAAQFSLSLGRKEEDEAARVVGNGVMMMVFFGALYVILVEIFLIPLLNIFGCTPEILPYAVEYTRITTIGMPFLMIMNGISNLARADGSPLFSMVTMLVGAIVNTILDPIFIFPLHLGVAGAAWATIIGQIVSCVVALFYLGRFQRVTLKKEYFRISLKRVGRTFTMGMSNGLTQLALTLVQVVINNSLVYYGAQTVYGSEIPLASAGIVMKVNGILMAIYIGINQGMQPIVGFNYGAKFFKRVRKTYLFCVIVEFFIGLTGLFVFQVFPEQVLALFGKGNDLYLEFAVLFMRTFLLMIPVNGIQMLSSNFFAAIGKPVKGALLVLTRTVFLFIPIMLILPIFLGMRGILMTAPIADGISFVIVMIFIAREMKVLASEQEAVV